MGIKDSYILLKVTIRGPNKNVEKAKKMLTEMSTERQLKSSSVTIRAKAKYHKFW